MSSRQLWHATPVWRLPAIVRSCLDPAQARGKTRGVWLYEPSARQRLTKHLAAHQGVRACDLIHLQVHIARCDLRRARKGIWVCSRCIYPAEVLDAYRFDQQGNWRRTNTWRVQLATASMVIAPAMLKDLVRNVVRHLSVEGGPL